MNLPQALQMASHGQLGPAALAESPLGRAEARIATYEAFEDTLGVARTAPSSSPLVKWAKSQFPGAPSAALSLSETDRPVGARVP